VSAGRQGFVAVEDAYIIQAQETALEDIMPVFVPLVHPPGEIY